MCTDEEEKQSNDDECEEVETENIRMAESAIDAGYTHCIISKTDAIDILVDTDKTGDD